jgi:hypothetical protein
MVLKGDRTSDFLGDGPAPFHRIAELGPVAD